MRFGTASTEEKRRYEEIGNIPRVSNIERRLKEESEADLKFSNSANASSDLLFNKGEAAAEQLRTHKDRYALFQSAPNVGEKFDVAASGVVTPAATTPKPALQFAAKINMEIASL